MLARDPATESSPVIVKRIEAQRLPFVDAKRHVDRAAARRAHDRVDRRVVESVVLVELP